MMHYRCSVEGCSYEKEMLHTDRSLLREVFDHEKSHPELDINNPDNYEESDYHKFCSHCGCTEEHERTVAEDARTLSVDYTEKKMEHCV